jgi:hypothetical protein
MVGAPEDFKPGSLAKTIEANKHEQRLTVTTSAIGSISTLLQRPFHQLL